MRDSLHKIDKIRESRGTKILTKHSSRLAEKNAITDYAAAGASPAFVNVCRKHKSNALLIGDRIENLIND